MFAYDEAELIEDSFIINGSVVIDDDYDTAMSWIYNDFPSLHSCPFCSKPLATFGFLVHEKRFAINYEEYEFEQGQKAELKTCCNCAYWQWFYEDGLDLNSYGCPDHFWHCAISKTNEYTTELPDVCYSEIAVALRRNPKLCHSFDPYKLERFVAAVFKANFKDCEVIHVGRADDGGVDVIFVDAGSKQWLIQVKRREHEKASEGVGTVRNLIGAMVLEDSSYGMIVSTADHFTYRAYHAVGRANEKGKCIRLIDKGKLLRIVGPLLPDLHWFNFVKTYYPELAEVFARKHTLLRENMNQAAVLNILNQR